MAAATAPEVRFDQGAKDSNSVKTVTTISEMDVGVSLQKSAPSIIEAEDLNYVECLSDPIYANKELTNPFDEIASRKWVNDVVMNFPRGPPADCRKRPTAEVSIKNVQVTYGPNDTFRVRVYVPETVREAPAQPALIMCHGGGWMHSSPEVDEDLAIFFASELRSVIVNVDYRLSPEYKFPIPRDDCYQALQWTIDHAGEYKIDIKRIAFWGASAGGNLAASVALRDAEEHQESRICHLSLVVPALSHPEHYPPAMESMEASVNKFDAELGKQAVGILLGKYAGENMTHPHVSLLRTDGRPNHPPVHITVGGRDFLRDEGIAYSLRLRNIGVDSQLEIIPGMPHGVNFPPTTHAARQFFMNQARVLDYALNRD